MKFDDYKPFKLCPTRYKTKWNWKHLQQFKSRKSWKKYALKLLQTLNAKQLKQTLNVAFVTDDAHFTGDHETSKSSDFSFSTVLKMISAENHAPSKTRFYLAQCPMETLPTSLKDLLPEVKISSKFKVDETFAWINLSDGKVMSDWHYDSKPNFLSVLVGNKVVELVSPKHGMKHFGYRSVENLSPNFPMKTSQPKDSQIMRFTLRKLETLYIPPGWWHKVKSSKGCFAVNYWCSVKAQSLHFTQARDLILSEIIQKYKVMTETSAKEIFAAVNLSSFNAEDLEQFTRGLNVKKSCGLLHLLENENGNLSSQVNLTDELKTLLLNRSEELRKQIKLKLLSDLNLIER